MVKDSKTGDFGNYDFSRKNQNFEWKTTLNQFSTVKYFIKKFRPSALTVCRAHWNINTWIIWRNATNEGAGWPHSSQFTPGPTKLSTISTCREKQWNSGRWWSLLISPTPAPSMDCRPLSRSGSQYKQRWRPFRSSRSIVVILRKNIGL